MPRRIDASHTGPATASGGGVAISGVHCGDIHVHPSAPCRSLYRDSVVTQIAPPSLRGRETELEELRHFCTVSDGEPYVWWQASAWSGKTALLSWFVLNPPPDVRVVSFFITARLKSHSDRSAFLEFVLAQLSEILDEPMPTVTDASGEVEFRDRLARAARLCAERGERLLLVVDGLDEDRGVTAGPDAYSIAALLPQKLPDGVRVVVAGRPNPPIPEDVPAAHPLRRPSVVRALAASPHAMAVQTDMRREIRQLLHGSELEQDLLGLVTAAGGGLSGPDLAELTRTRVFIVEEHLRTVTGRSFAKRPAGWRPDTHPEVYLLGHEEIQVEAVNRLGEAALREHRERLHEWADSYRSRGWPPETPEYLLRGYSRLLHEIGDRPRMLAIVTDRARHDRLFTTSGGDFAALGEISAVQEMLQTVAPGDLASLGRVAVHRLRITKRAESIRVNLPHVWARLGQPERAETLARSMPDPDRRAWALAGVARAVAADGHPEKALRITESVTVQGWRSYGLTGVARALALGGELDRARQLALWAEEATEGVEAMARLMEVYALCGDNERVRQLFRSCKLDDHDAWALPGPLATAGDIAGAQEIAASINDPRWRTYALIGIAHALARSGDRGRAREFAAQASDQAAFDGSDRHGFAMAPLVTVLFEIGERDQAARLADRIEETITAAEPTFHQAYAWAELAKAVAATGDLDRAGEYAERAEQATMAEIGMDRELAAVVQPLQTIGEPELARRAAQQIADPYVRAWALTAIATAADTVLAQAKAAAMSIAEPGFRLDALDAVADLALRVGDVPTARVLIDNSVEVARALSGDFYAVSGLAPAIVLSGRLGESGRARELANRAEEETTAITHPSVRAAAMGPVLTALGVCGEVNLAREMAQRLERFAVEAGDRLDADSARAHLVVALVAADRDHATEVARRIENKAAMMFHSGCLPVVLTGDFDRAEQTAKAIDDGPAHLFLAQLAEAAAANGDPRRALRLAREAAQPLTTDNELWHDAALVVLIGAMVRLGERAQAAELAAGLRSLHARVWAVAESAQDPAQQRVAVALALRVTDWSPVWQMVPSPSDSR
ncbi:hypothetical protein AB0283_15785, partial [Micromonospora vinacea]|uniref:hypothetical protein n=1 Tax=Micromonospora vinacea TaxID=709878 RepID=UPI00344C6ECF